MAVAVQAISSLGRGSGHKQDADSCLRAALVELLAALFHKAHNQEERSRVKAAYKECWSV